MVSKAALMIRSASLSGYVALAQSLGLNPHTMMRRAGLNPRCLDNPDMQISVEAVRQLLEASAAAAGVQDFGLRLASERRLANLGPLSIVLREEPTARQALDTMARYLRLLNASMLTRIEDLGELVVIREEFLIGANADSVRNSMELAVGVMHRILVELLGPRWRPRRVCFSHRAPHDLRMHHAMFGAHVEFNSEFNGIVCAARDLAAPLPEAHTGMAQYARRFLDESLSSAGRDTSDSVRQLIAALLPGGRCTTDQVAQHFGIDRRTLHRRLLAEGQTFSSLMQSVRAEFAARQVRESDRNLTELAQMLGFSSASALAYWFKRSFGMTVLQWRHRSQTSRQN